MSRKGNCEHNAVSERIFGSLNTEWSAGQRALQHSRTGPTGRDSLHRNGVQQRAVPFHPRPLHAEKDRIGCCCLNERPRRGGPNNWSVVGWEGASCSPRQQPDRRHCGTPAAPLGASLSRGDHRSPTLRLLKRLGGPRSGPTERWQSRFPLKAFLFFFSILKSTTHRPGPAHPKVFQRNTQRYAGVAGIGGSGHPLTPFVISQ